jgi:hypothetical protein
MIEQPVEPRVQGAPARIRRLQLLEQVRQLDLGGDHGQRRLVYLFVGLFDLILMFLYRGFEPRQHELGCRQMTLGVKLSYASLTQAVVLRRLVVALHGLDDALRHLVLGFVEGGSGLRENAIGLGDNLLGAGDCVVCIREFLGCFVALGYRRGQFTT